MYRAIGDYGLIGNTQSAALISAEGSLDWCCLPRFDSHAWFLKILDDEKGGYCTIKTDGNREHRRRYLPKTNVLETTLLTDAGELVITDFMPIRSPERAAETGNDTDPQPQVIRLFRCVRGQFAGSMEIFPTPNNAKETAKFSGESTEWRVIGKNDELRLHSSHPLQRAANGLEAKLQLNSGDNGFLVLTHSSSRAYEAVSRDSLQKKLDSTRQYWEKWTGNFSYEGDHADVVLRSALALKLLVYEKTGAIVAAPSNSLPEWIGGKRNWDYRYNWLRDAALTLVALMNVGYCNEAKDFLQFLRNTLPRDPSQFQIMYLLDGGTNVKESELKHLSGYRASSPVHVGNGAVKQTQLDIFGELAHCTYIYWNHPGFDHRGEKFGDTDWKLISSCADYVAKNWQKPGNGIWEMRGSKQQMTYSKAMCWVMLDRALKLAHQFGMDAPHADQWKKTRQKIFDEFTRKGYNATLPGFVQTYGSNATDAALLRMALYDIFDPQEGQMRATVELVERRLLKNGLLYRYRLTDDGVSGDEGTFTACSFWLIENYVLQNRLEDAKRMFRHVLSFASDLGLLSEEINPDTGELLGNYPQGFTHIGLINAAVRIAQAERGKKSDAYHVLEGNLPREAKKAA